MNATLAVKLSLVVTALFLTFKPQAAIAEETAVDSSPTHHAGFYIEPGLTYEFNSKSSLALPSPLSNTTGSIEGLGLSVKGGFHISDVIFGGADLRYAQPKFKDSSNNLETRSTEQNYAALIGAQTPLYGIRIWGEYVFGGSLDPEADRGIDYNFKDAKGLRLGAGIRYRMVSLNLEYQDLKYGTTEAVVAGVPVSSTTSNLTDKALIAGVSFPLDL